MEVHTLLKRILILHTGGTFGMNEGDGPLLTEGSREEVLQRIPELQRIAHIETLSPYAIDSAELEIGHLRRQAGLIVDNHDGFDGFVIIHGTDTMAYTASALSFMLLGLGKPVILTGAQRPLNQIRSDARSNLIGAVEIAASGIPEVGIFFGNKIYRGNRTTKISTWSYDAFESPNFPPLGEVGLDINLTSPEEKETAPREDFKPFLDLDPAVFVVMIFPGIKEEYLESLLKSDIRGFILQAYGAGNMPTGGGEGLLDFIARAHESGKPVAVNTQCHHGSVFLDIYESARRARELGAVSCKDMTIEASVTKLMYLLGRYGEDPRRVPELLETNLAGELSEPQYHIFNQHGPWR
ncbi:MAG: asparaginase [Spirochaetia bacterium]